MEILQLKKENVQIKKYDIFHNYSQKVDCGNSLGPLQRGGSNENQQPMFFSQKKNYPS